ncbi:hypothetical protein P20495_2001 [Pseudoalteromonas sp. BSi20495]|nr:hypothetical protein P20495_2001 [Pseudoalteromonas sp. BSi20495]
MLAKINATNPCIEVNKKGALSAFLALTGNSQPIDFTQQ